MKASKQILCPQRELMNQSAKIEHFA